MTVIQRASPWDNLRTLRRAGITAAITDSQPEPDLVGAGDRR